MTIDKKLAHVTYQQPSPENIHQKLYLLFQIFHCSLLTDELTHLQYAISNRSMYKSMFQEHPTGIV